MKCCKEFLLPGGVQIPFCAYNTLGYREQARKQLEARERGRNRARHAGEPYTPAPITFSFDGRDGTGAAATNNGNVAANGQRAARVIPVHAARQSSGTRSTSARQKVQLAATTEEGIDGN